MGLAYPLASRLAGQNASAIGDANDPFGGLGRNGALDAGADAQVFGGVGTGYAFRPGRIYNMDGETLIGGHGDIVHPETVYALLAAAATAP